MTDTGQGGGVGGDHHEIFGPLERSGSLRGWLLVAGVVVIGALLLPSATRASLGTTTAATTATTAGPPSNGVSATPPPSSTPSSTTTTATAPVTIAPSSIKVLVANGTNTSGAAAAVSSFLSGKGFSTLTPIDALTVVHASQVYAVNGATTAARDVALALGLAESAIEPASHPVPVASLRRGHGRGHRRTRPHFSGVTEGCARW